MPPADEENHPVIRAHHRLKGGAAQLGASGPGPIGPFGTWPADDRHDRHDDDDQEHELAVDRTRETTT